MNRTEENPFHQDDELMFEIETFAASKVKDANVMIILDKNDMIMTNFNDHKSWFKLFAESLAFVYTNVGKDRQTLHQIQDIILNQLDAQGEQNVEL